MYMDGSDQPSPPDASPEQAVTQAVLEYLSSAPGSLFAGQTVTLVDHWQGSENLLWRVHTESAPEDGGVAVEAVAKLYLDAGWVRGRRAHDAQAAFAPMGLAPRPLWFDREPEGLSRQIALYAWVEGDAPAADDPGALDAVAEAAAAVHRGDGATLPRIAPHPMALATFGEILEGSVRAVRTWLNDAEAAAVRASFERLGDAARSRIAASLPLWQGAPATPVHGDLSLENTLLHRGRALLLDWEMAGMGDPALEVARFLTNTPFAQPDDADAWLARYLAQAATPLLAERIAAYRDLLPFEWLCRLLLGAQEHAAVLDAGDRADLRLLIDALFHAAGRTLDCPVHDVGPGLEALLTPPVSNKWDL